MAAAPPRLFHEAPLTPGTGAVELTASAARHVQVLRLQPGDPVLLFDGRGGQWTAQVLQMGRREVTVALQSFDLTERELPCQITVAAGMPANERFDWLVEKATELGAAAIQPLVCERSVLRVSGERAQRKRDHWQGIAIAAAEQCGRTRVPTVHEPLALQTWLDGLPPPATPRWLLSPGATPRLAGLTAQSGAREHVVLSGPEGGLSPREEQAALDRGFAAVQLGPRTLRAETAPLVALTCFPVD